VLLPRFILRGDHVPHGQRSPSQSPCSDRYREPMLRRPALAVALAAALALTGCSSGSEHEAQREAFGESIPFELQFHGPNVAITTDSIIVVSPDDYTAWGVGRWEFLYDDDLSGMNVTALQYTVEYLDTEAVDFDAYSLGSTNWEVTTSTGEIVRSAFRTSDSPDCVPFDDAKGAVLASTGRASGCAIFFIPEGETIREVHFTGVDRSSRSRRSIGPTVRYVTWTVA